VGTRLYEEQLKKNGKQLSEVDLPLTVKIHVAETDLPPIALPLIISDL
jgi:hypothetical protein